LKPRLWKSGSVVIYDAMFLKAKEGDVAAMKENSSKSYPPFDGRYLKTVIWMPSK
jgi:hypothetical protein